MRTIGVGERLTRRGATHSAGRGVRCGEGGWVLMWWWVVEKGGGLGSVRRGEV